MSHLYCSDWLEMLSKTNFALFLTAAFANLFALSPFPRVISVPSAMRQAEAAAAAAAAESHFCCFSASTVSDASSAMLLALVRKVLVSVKFLSAILGPVMGASILWTPEKNAFFLQEKTMSKNPRFRGGVFWVLGGGGVPILLLWARGLF